MKERRDGVAEISEEADAVVVRDMAFSFVG